MRDKEQEIRWVNRLRRCLKDMPESLEIVIEGETQVAVHTAGTMLRHLNRDTNHGIVDDPIGTISVPRVYPYGESL